MSQVGTIGHVARLRTQRLHSSLLRARPPLVSCIMPTCNRRALVPQAIQYFLRQDYPNRELIVVDDGTDAIADLIPSDHGILYVRLAERRTIGAKRNIACQAARGKIVVHWDDDDWMADWRLTYQVTELLRQQIGICGLDKLVYYDVQRDQSWQYIYSAGRHPWVAGNTLCYWKILWAQNPFPDVNMPEENFLWNNHPKSIVALQEVTFYVALIHHGNVSPKRTHLTGWHVYPNSEVRQLLGEDWASYVNLRQLLYNTDGV